MCHCSSSLQQEPACASHKKKNSFSACLLLSLSLPLLSVPHCLVLFLAVFPSVPVYVSVSVSCSSSSPCLSQNLSLFDARSVTHLIIYKQLAFAFFAEIFDPVGAQVPQLRVSGRTRGPGAVDAVVT